MTKLAKLKDYIHSLEDMGNIMTAMKNLSLIEVNKIRKFLENQEEAMKMLKKVGLDFLHFYPQFSLSKPPNTSSIYILIGSERGFCGKINERIGNFVEHLNSKNFQYNPQFIVIGSKLASKLSHNTQVIESIEGPNTTEEISHIILKLTKVMEKKFLTAQFNFRLWSIVSCKLYQNSLKIKKLKLFFELDNNNSSLKSFPPMLNVPPDKFFIDFMNQYLFATLYVTLYQSFFAENYQRFYHLDNALMLLQRKIFSVTNKMNLLRQEEITQEIQIIMLSIQAIKKEIGL